MFYWSKERVDAWLTVQAECHAPAINGDCDICIYRRECDTIWSKVGCFFCELYEDDCISCTGRDEGCFLIPHSEKVDRAIEKIERLEVL